MSIKVFGAPGSTATLRVRACLAEKDLDYEFILVDLATKEHKNPEFLSRNPFGQVPAFEDGDLKMFGCEEDGDIQAVWMEVESQKYEPATSNLFVELCLKPMWGMAIDEAVVEANEKKLEEVLDIYEKRLSESKYLGGDSFTLADLHHLPNLKYLMGTKVKKLFDARPHVSAWASEILARPAWVKATAA
ncbi:hypothetical protein L6452_43329 [Arctium lappa]|uniref:Uncharacterized protein n=1 Tax=Arctium lappa TaxID=4217 RepID=A0ACB8XLY5_ARCLA|nr:hypothetical protein L6452_43329 [Arctium lappa]